VPSWQREWAYDRNSHVGKLDQAFDEAQLEAGVRLRQLTR
jgi:hypothetical protein